ncbi:MAG: hypothetical protein M5R36_13160 [Deltaproteobacteria bacterium]|nr:hypothetical protein [Deltaproteobacteria bacterium]
MEYDFVIAVGKALETEFSFRVGGGAQVGSVHDDLDALQGHERFGVERGTGHVAVGPRRGGPPHEEEKERGGNRYFYLPARPMTGAVRNRQRTLPN